MVSVGLLLYEEFLMSGSNLSTHIFHVGNLSKSNSKSPKQNFWSQCHLDQNFMRISKIVVSVYAKGLSANNFCHAQRILSVKQPPPLPPPPSLAHISLLISMVNHWPLLANFQVSLVNWWLVKHCLPMGGNYQCYDW